MDKIIKKVTSVNLGYRMGNKRICMGCYDDDPAIIAESENDLQRQLFQFFQTSHQLSMNISTKKSKCMKESHKCEIVVEDNPIEHVMKFRYQTPTTMLKT